MIFFVYRCILVRLLLLFVILLDLVSNYCDFLHEKGLKDFIVRKTNNIAAIEKKKQHVASKITKEGASELFPPAPALTPEEEAGMRHLFHDPKYQVSVKSEFY